MREKDKNPSTHKLVRYSGIVLKEKRLELGLTQEELAELLSFETDESVNTKTVQRWEKATHKLPAWVYFHLEMLIKESMDIKAVEDTSASLLQLKNSLANKVMNKVNSKLKGE